MTFLLPENCIFLDKQPFRNEPNDRLACTVLRKEKGVPDFSRQYFLEKSYLYYIFSFSFRFSNSSCA